MRVSKKTYTKRRKGTKKRNYKKKVKSIRKRVRGGADPVTPDNKTSGKQPAPPTKLGYGFIRMKKRKLAELRQTLNKPTKNTPPESPKYKEFAAKDLGIETDSDFYQTGFAIGYRDSKLGNRPEFENNNGHISQHYSEMSEQEEAADDNENYKEGYIDGYLAQQEELSSKNLFT